MLYIRTFISFKCKLVQQQVRQTIDRTIPLLQHYSKARIQNLIFYNVDESNTELRAH